MGMNTTAQIPDAAIVTRRHALSSPLRPRVTVMVTVVIITSMIIFIDIAIIIISIIIIAIIALLVYLCICLDI